jgi:hypothetical protein
MPVRQQKFDRSGSHWAGKAQHVGFLIEKHPQGRRQTDRGRGRYRGRSRDREARSCSDMESDCDPDTDTDPDDGAQADSSGSQPKVPGSAGVIITSLRDPPAEP